MNEWTPVPGGVWLALRHFLEPYVGARFTVPGDPVPKQRPRHDADGHTFTPKATKAAEKVVRQAFQQAMPGWEAEPDWTYGVLIDFRTRGGSQADLDNATKLMWDALNKVFWADDIQVGDSYLHLVRGGGEPGVEVLLFRVADNGTLKTKICECGNRYRARSRRCSPCTKSRTTVRELTAGPDPDAEQFDRWKRTAFSHIVGCDVGGLPAPTYASLAVRIGTSEPTARKVVAALIADGCLTRDGRKFKILRALGAA